MKTFNAPKIKFEKRTITKLNNHKKASKGSQENLSATGTTIIVTHW